MLISFSIGKKIFLSIHDSYLEMEFVLSNNAGGVFGENSNISVVDYGMMALFS